MNLSETVGLNPVCSWAYLRALSPFVPRYTGRLLNKRIQGGAHDSVEDASVAMELYQMSMRYEDQIQEY
jgi:hypothetical protein